MSGVDAGRALCRLLADPTLPYRSVWEQRGAAYRGRELNQTAINKVIASFLVDVGVLAEFEEAEWPRSRRDWVRSRLAGDILTHLELELFMDAFRLEDSDRDRLRHLLETEQPMFLPGELRLDGLPDRSTYAVERVVDEHVVGPDGLPISHRTIQTIRALTDAVAAHLCLVDSGTVDLQVSKGGTAAPIQQVSNELWAVVITLDGELGEGETCELVYDATFDYPEQPTPELRRAASQHAEGYDMSVSFHPDRLPSSVHLSTWATIADVEPVTSVAVDLDSRHRATARWTSVRAGLVGFSWAW